MHRFRRYQRWAMFGVAALIAALAGGGIAPGTSHADPTSAIITNGTVMLGVNDTGSLNVGGGTASSGSGTTVVGLRYVPTGAESTADGCTCEGWGAGDVTTSTEGYANTEDGNSGNLSVISFTVDAESAVSVTEIGTTLRVTHDYHPNTVSDYVYDVVVTIENISEDPVHLLYRRSMDWDIEPTAFHEFVTMVPGDSPELVYTSDGGFDSDHVLDAPEMEIAEGAFVDSGPADHGALFDFDFGTLAAGGTKTFNTFYGAAGTENDALAALAAVSAEAYTLGQPNTEGGPDLGVPNTFFFGFKGIGGHAIGEPTPTVEASPTQGRLKTHTPTRTPTSGPTETPVPPTNTPEASATAVATSPTGGRAGAIAGPDTGSGPGDGSSRSTTLLFGGFMLAIAGIFVGSIGRKLRQ